MPRGVEIHRFRTSASVECEALNCPLPAECTRERVRQHVKKTGHTVRVVVEDVTRYEPETNSNV